MGKGNRQQQKHYDHGFYPGYDGLYEYPSVWVNDILVWENTSTNNGPGHGFVFTMRNCQVKVKEKKII